MDSRRGVVPSIALVGFPVLGHSTTLSDHRLGASPAEVVKKYKARGPQSRSLGPLSLLPLQLRIIFDYGFGLNYTLRSTREPISL